MLLPSHATVCKGLYRKQVCMANRPSKQDTGHRFFSTWLKQFWTMYKPWNTYHSSGELIFRKDYEYSVCCGMLCFKSK
ncbi:hypothetical protein XENTR_v10014655 [Xenopus tropicalis]|nr:hypothetical protein XENTR_v10014655 [Xenopus tropicalis]